MKKNLLNIVLILIGAIIALAGTIGIGTSANSPFANIVWIFQVVGVLIVIVAVVRIILSAKENKTNDVEFLENTEEENDKS